MNGLKTCLHGDLQNYLSSEVLTLWIIQTRRDCLMEMLERPIVSSDNQVITGRPILYTCCYNLVISTCECNISKGSFDVHWLCSLLVYLSTIRDLFL